MGIKYRIRKKGKYHSLDKITDGRVQSKNLEPVKLWLVLEEYYGAFNEVSKDIKKKVSKVKRKNKPKSDEKFAQHILSALSENDMTEYEANDLYELNK